MAQRRLGRLSDVSRLLGGQETVYYLGTSLHWTSFNDKFGRVNFSINAIYVPCERGPYKDISNKVVLANRKSFTQSLVGKRSRSMQLKFESPIGPLYDGSIEIIYGLMHNHILTDPQLVILLTEVENILNSPPFNTCFRRYRRPWCLFSQPCFAGAKQKLTLYFKHQGNSHQELKEMETDPRICRPLSGLVGWKSTYHRWWSSIAGVIGSWFPKKKSLCCLMTRILNRESGYLAESNDWCSKCDAWSKRR